VHESLTALLQAGIERHGPLTFAEFMEAALYDPQFGYYGAGRGTIGRAGDFITSVSVGPLFGRLLARHFLKTWERLERPERFTLVEQGAHDATLAGDVLAALEGSECWTSLEYVIAEPATLWRERQQGRLGTSGKVRWVERLDELPPVQGVVFCNELLDAFPVHRVRWTGEAWREMYVVADEAGFAWREGELSSSELHAAVEKIPMPLPAGYDTEVNLRAAEWVGTAGRAISRGAVLVIDYGYERPEFYRPERAGGTLSAYGGHERVSEVLSRPGEIDLTSHVDFTTISDAGEAAGLRLAGFTDQHRFLGALGAALFSEECPMAARELRAFQTLTHPELLGAAFKVMWFERG
jgi:SAM-dependent MidA family methyltransferase